MSMNTMRLQPNKEEAFEFCIRGFELNERTFRDILSSATYTAACLKKRITSMPSNVGIQYARLYAAYNQQVSDVRNLKVVVSITQRVGWKPLVPVIRKLLAGLPLSSNNVPLLAAKLQEMYPGPERRCRPPSQAAARVREEIHDFSNESHMHLQELHTGLENFRAAQNNLEDVLAQIRANKEEIITRFQRECSAVMQSDDSQSTKAELVNRLKALSEQQLFECKREEESVLKSIEAQKATQEHRDRHRATQMSEVRPVMQGMEADLARTHEAIERQRSQLESRLAAVEQQHEAQARENMQEHSNRLKEYRRQAEMAESAVQEEAQRRANAERAAKDERARADQLEAELAAMRQQLSQATAARGVAELRSL